MKYKIVIISYKRADIIIEKTLKILEESKIPSNIIDVWVANKEEYKHYKKKLDHNIYNNLLIGKEGIHNVRTAVRMHYPENYPILNLDDDIQNIEILKNGKLKPLGTKLHKLNHYVFKLMKKHNTGLCGIYAARNPYFMDNSYSKGLYYCIGSMYWTLNTKDPNLNVTLEDKEDYERTIKSYLKYKHILRLNNITVNTKYYTQKGGMQETRNPERVEKSGRYLIKKYPKYFMKNCNRKKHFEIQFKKQPNNKKIQLKDVKS